MTHRYIIAIVPAATTGIAIYDTKEKTLRHWMDFERFDYATAWLLRRVEIDKMIDEDAPFMFIRSCDLSTCNVWFDFAEKNRIKRTIDFESARTVKIKESVLSDLGINHRSLSSSIKQAVMIVMEKVK